ncbi:MAG: protoporphyrinogen oxidase [Candidatus Sumerlaeaceae bacterium]
MQTPQFQVVVVGAGISGLVCAYRLAGGGMRTALVESSHNVGGVIRTGEVDGFLLEYGPNSFSSSPDALALLEELGLLDEAEIQPIAKHDRYIWRRGKLRRVPTGPAQLITSRLLSFREKYDVLHGFVARFPAPSADMELGAFCRQRVGDGAVDVLVKPGIAGIFAADADRISLEATLPEIFPTLCRTERLIDAVRAIKAVKAAATNNGAVPRSLVSFRGGLAALSEKLRESFVAAGGALLLNNKVTGLRATATEDTGWNLMLGNESSIECEQLVLTQPSSACAALLRDVSSSATEIIQATAYAPVVVVHVGLRSGQLRESRSGFGFLTVRNEGVRALGMIWSDRIFSGRAPAGHRLLTCFYGGDIDPDAVRLDDAALRAQVLADLKTTMGLRDDSTVLFQVTRLPQAIPIFRVGHVARMKHAAQALPDTIKLLGNYTGGVSIPDCIVRGNDAARQLLTQFAQHEKPLVP